MKKYILLAFLAFFITGCTAAQVKNSSLILGKCPSNIAVLTLFNSDKFGYPSETAKMAGGYLYTWNITDKYYSWDRAAREFNSSQWKKCKFQAFVGNDGKIQQYKTPMFLDDNEKEYNYCDGVLRDFSAFLGTVDQAGNVNCNLK